MSRSSARQPKQPITDRRYVMTFGKYKSESVQDILDNDPLYIVWLQDNTDMDFHHTILEEAAEGPRHTFTGYSTRSTEPK